MIDPTVMKHLRLYRLTRLWRFASIALLPLLLGQSGGQALSQAEKNALLSRKKWYVTYTFVVGGSGGDVGSTWHVGSHSEGTIEMGHAIPGQFPSSSTAADVQDTTPGRFITWMAMWPDETYRRMDAGETNPARLEGMYYPFEKVVDAKTTVQVGDGVREDTWRGAGRSYAIGPCMFSVDLKKGTYDLIFSVGPTDFGTPVTHTWRSPSDSGQEEASPSHHIAWMPNEYVQQFLGRKLRPEMKPDGTISFGIQGGVPYSGSAGTGTLNFVGTFKISPTPPSMAKLILTPERDYSKWRPKPGESETERGNFMRVDWRVEEQGRQPEVEKVMFRLAKVSNYTGVCMNWPIPTPPPPGQKPPTPKFDLAFLRPLPGLADYVNTEEDQVLSIGGAAAAAARGEVFIECFDGAAIGELVAEATLKDGRTIQCEIDGQPGTRKLLIPDREEGVSDIASHWRMNRAGTLPDNDDSENIPEGDSQQGSGDGLTVWEEYRGFRQGFEWNDNCFPRKKDLFIDNRLGDSVAAGIGIFRKNTQLVVHEYLDESEHKPDRVINFNKRADRWVVDQHCIVMIRIASGASYCDPVGPPHPGPPRNTEVVAISDGYPDLTETYYFKAKIYFSYNVRDNTVAHELSHAVGVYHHGDRDPKDGDNNPGILWFWQLANGVPQILEGERPGSVIRVLKEPGLVPLGIEQVFLNNDPEKRQIVGMKHGEHSGDVECYMRYYVAHYYEYQASPMTRVLHGDNEGRGTKLCTSDVGTYFNYINHSPEPRYGDADTMRGDCLHQFVVSDKLSVRNRRP